MTRSQREYWFRIAGIVTLIIVFALFTIFVSGPYIAKQQAKCDGYLNPKTPYLCYTNHGVENIGW